MYPPVDENDEAYVAHRSHQGYIVPVVVPPTYGPPQIPSYAPPYNNNSVRGPMIRTQRWSTGLCRCLDDPGNCKTIESILIHVGSPEMIHLYILFILLIHCFFFLLYEHQAIDIVWLFIV